MGDIRVVSSYFKKSIRWMFTRSLNPSFAVPFHILPDYARIADRKHIMLKFIHEHTHGLYGIARVCSTNPPVGYIKIPGHRSGDPT